MPTNAKIQRRHKRVAISTGSKSNVEQQHANEVNINTIMRKMHAQGVLPHFRTGGNFGDFTLIDTFHEAQNRIIAANNDFMALPSELRAQFSNDPGRLIEFLENPENRREAIEMGLIAPDGYKPPLEEKTPEKASQGPSEGNPKSDPKAASDVSA